MRSGLQGKQILFCVSGSIAAYKACEWVSALSKEEALVTVAMTEAAQRFVAPLTFAALSGNRVHGSMFAEDPEGVMAHIALSREADAIVLAPASAQSIARLSLGLADDLVSTCILAAKKPVIVCPAMNTNMLEHRATQEHLNRLRQWGYHLIEGESGHLACGEQGAGRLVNWEPVREKLLSLFAEKDLAGEKVLITAGPTHEPLDPARYLTNRSSGKMGYALARAAARRGADVVLVSGPVRLSPPPGLRSIPVTSADTMFKAVMQEADSATVIIKAAAVADFKPSVTHEKKIKKGKSQEFTLNLSRNKDILAHLGQQRKPGQILVGFAAESNDHDQEGRRKLQEKNADMVVVNDILSPDAGFDVDTNRVTLLDAQDKETLPLLSKEQTADRILDKILALRRKKSKS